MLQKHCLLVIFSLAVSECYVVSDTTTSSDREASMMQLMASMSSVGGADSLQDIWAMMESGLSPRPVTPRHLTADSMCGLYSSSLQLFSFPVGHCMLSSFPSSHLLIFSNLLFNCFSPKMIDYHHYCYLFMLLPHLVTVNVFLRYALKTDNYLASSILLCIPELPNKLSVFVIILCCSLV